MEPQSQQEAPTLETSGKEAFDLVQAELAALHSGRGESVHPKELDDLRHYARRRTDLQKPDSELTETQRAWKVAYYALDEVVEKACGAETKARIDAAEDEIELWSAVKKSAQKRIVEERNKDRGLLFFSLSAIFGLIVGWVLAGLLGSLILGFLFTLLSLLIGALIMESVFSGTFLGVYMHRLGRLIGSQSMKNAAERIYSRAIGLDESRKQDLSNAATAVACKKIDELFDLQLIHFRAPDETDYRKGVNEAGLTSQEKTDEERTASAEKVLSLVNLAEEKIIDPLLKINEDLGDLLYDFSVFLEQLPQNERRTKLLEWYETSKELFLNRVGYTNYMLASRDWDRREAQDILDHGGSKDFSYPAEVVEEMAEIAKFAVIVTEKDFAICSHRKKLSDEIF